jgi:SAM-dependent methyltransferase
VALCSLLECGSCGLRFFDHRYDDEEMKRLYSGYRGEAYFQARHRHEFWYLRRHNDGTGHAANILAKRKSATAAFIHGHTDVQVISRVLDYGGDSGQFMPDGIGNQRDVFEVSDAAPIPGVRRLSEENQLEANGYDLVLLNHVLEHAADPADLLRRVAWLMKPGTGLLHVEVPLERYDLTWVRQGEQETRRLVALASHPTWLKWLDFYSTLCRVALKSMPPFGFLKRHEHLNLFDERALSMACRSVGLEVLAVETDDRGSGAVVAALARRPVDGTS